MTKLKDSKNYAESLVAVVQPKDTGKIASLLGKRKSTRVGGGGSSKIQKVKESASASKATKSGCMGLMLAKTWDEDTDEPKGWFMSEKLDGVRCFWNGTTMYTRNGNLFYPPDWFKDMLPKDLALDGELWTKRDDF